MYKRQKKHRCIALSNAANDDYMGTISYGVFTTIVTEAANRVLRLYKKGDLVIENITVYFIKPVQIESVIEIRPKLLELGRKFAKLDVEVYNVGL